MQGAKVEPCAIAPANRGRDWEPTRAIENASPNRKFRAERLQITEIAIAVNPQEYDFRY